MPLVSGYVLPSLVTVLLHLALLLLVGENWNREPPQRQLQPQVINARLVSVEQAKPAPAPKQRQPAQQMPAKKPPPKPTPKPKKPEPKPEPKPDPKPDLKQQQAEQARLEREREKAAAERALAAQLAEEEAYLEAQSQQELAMSHIGAIQQSIAQNWSRPPSARRDMEVTLEISLIPTGEVVSVRVVHGSGNSAFDRSAINAVNKAARFPDLARLPPRVFETYFRELRLVFRPEDLRL